jgi:hypothetical protein
MKKVNIFEREVTFFKDVKSREPIGNKTILVALTDHGCEDMVDKYRETKREENKLALPLFTCSGIFSTRKNDGLIKHNGVICIDIDFNIEKGVNTEVENFDKIRTLMKQIPYVAYCGHSCGGKGYFVLMPIENTEKHLQHYLSAIDDFERCGITVDKNCKNVSRTRFISYDNEAYFNYEAVEYSRVKEDAVYNSSVKELKRAKQLKAGSFSEKSVFEKIDFDEIKCNVELIIMLIERDGIDITEDYNNWIKIGAALANQFGENGRGYFHRVSQFHLKYNKRESDNKYNSCMKLRDITIATFFYIAKRYNIYL